LGLGELVAGSGPRGLGVRPSTLFALMSELGPSRLSHREEKFIVETARLAQLANAKIWGGRAQIEVDEAGNVLAPVHAVPLHSERTH
jgi:hypothetical protein